MTKTRMTETILIVDDSDTIMPELIERLRSLNYIVLTCETAEEALQKLQTISVSMIFVGSSISASFGESVLKCIAEKFGEMPVILVVSGGVVPEKIGCIRTGSFTVLVQPVDSSVLDHLLRQVASRARLLEDSGDQKRHSETQNAALEALVQSLERQNLKLQLEHKELAKMCELYRHEARENRAAGRALSAVQVAIDSTREAVLILSGDGRVEYCNPAFQELFGLTLIDTDVYPVHRIFADPYMSDKIKRNIEALGTFSCEVEMIGRNGLEFPTFVNANTVGDVGDAQRRTLYLITDMSEQEQLRREAHHDALTGLYTRGHFLDLLSSHTSMVARHGQAMSLCLCDLDNFKQANDRFGHRMGDRVLETFSWVVSQEIRKEDCAGRLGGDEFILMFPQVDAFVATVCMERIRRRFEAIVFETEEGDSFRCSVTQGLVDYPDERVSDEAFIELADKSLYRAKELGRNCTVVNMEVVGTSAA